MNLSTEYVEHYDSTKAERDLWASVILEAVESLNARSPKQRVEAMEWFNSTSTDVGSFLWVCAALNLPPSSVRRSIRNG